MATDWSRWEVKFASRGAALQVNVEFDWMYRTFTLSKEGGLQNPEVRLFVAGLMKDVHPFNWTGEMIHVRFPERLSEISILEKALNRRVLHMVYKSCGTHDGQDF